MDIQDTSRPSPGTDGMSEAELAALEDLLTEKGLLERGAMRALTEDLAARPPDADHRHA